MDQEKEELSSPARNYLKEEQKQRRQEIERLIERTEADQKNGLIVTGAVWAWLATNTDKLSGLFIYVTLLPPIIMAFFFYRWRMLSGAIKQAASYTQKLEKLFEVPDGFGWESYLTKVRKEEGEPEHMKHTTKLFWFFLLGLNVIIAILFILLKQQ